MMDNKKSKLVQIKLTEKAFSELNQLKEDTGSLSLTEVIRQSLAFYRWAVEQKNNGGNIFSKSRNKPNEVIEVIFPF